MACHCTTKSRAPHATGTTLADVVTYRFNGKMVYVQVEQNYTKALSLARDVFPELKGLRDASLSLSLCDSPDRVQNRVDISALAWPKMTPRMLRYQIIDVHDTRGRGSPVPIPKITITYADAENVPVEAEPAPPYSSSAGVVTINDEKASRCTPPRATSTSQAKLGRLFQKLRGQRAVESCRI